MTVTTPQCKVDGGELARKAALFREGTRRIYDGQGDRADIMWFFELWHFLGDVQTALRALPESTGGMVNSALIDPPSLEQRISSEASKTIVNWSGGSTLQTWKDGEWQILYAKDAIGREITLSLADHEAYRFAWSMSPAANDYFDRMRAATRAVYELSYPEARADSLRQTADEIECDGGCEGCSPQKLERGEFCGFVAAEDLRKLAAALDLKAKIDAESIPPTSPAEPVASDASRLGGVLPSTVRGTP